MAMDLYKFQEGDEVQMRVMGTVEEIDRDDDENPYLFKFEMGGDTQSHWVSEAELLGVADDSTRPIIPGDYVRTKGNRTVGVVKSLSKGQAGVDWAPFSPDEIANAWHNVTVLIAVTEEEALEERARVTGA